MIDEPALQVQNLKVELAGRCILDHVSFDVFPQEVVAVIGGSGAGKSVLLRAILGLVPVVKGKVSILGEDSLHSDSQTIHKLRSRIGVLFQHGALFSSLSVLENIMAPMRELDLIPSDLCAGLARLKIDMVGLPQSVADKYPSELSGGMTKRVGIARALALDPKLLFLDEPTSGLDPISALGIDELIRELCKNLGFAVFDITHDLDSLERVCDRILVLEQGRIIADGKLSQIKASENQWINTYFGVRDAALTSAV